MERLNVFHFFGGKKNAILRLNVEAVGSHASETPPKKY